MKRVYLILILGFLLEGILSNFILLSTHSFNLLFSLISIVLVYPFFKDNKKYYISCLIYGFVYDIVYTNTLFFHGWLFLCIGLFVRYSYQLFFSNILNVIVIVFLSILLYRFISYGLLCFTNYYDFSLLVLLKSITSSLFFNMFYMLLIYIVFRREYY